jgi:DNA-binding SARP family transcriptional activator
MTDLLSLSCLGPIKISLANAPLAKLNSEKLSALLFYLAMRAGHRLRREYLAELLWPDLPIEAARSNLRHAYFRLRQILNDDENVPPLLLSSRDWLSFNPDSAYRLDARELNSSSSDCPAGPHSARCKPCTAQLENIAGLYRGEFMADLSLPNCDEFNDWVQTERESLRRRALALLERLSICHEHNNGHGKAMPYAQRYLELEPWNEEGHRRVMRLYALSDQASAALSQYESCCRLLKMELGVLPSSETQKLAENIRNGQVRPTPADQHDGRAQKRRSSDTVELPVRLPRAALPAELRQATVLYCELTHTGDEGMDEAMILLQAPQDRCVEIIRQFSGHLVTTHGGGLLAYFGYPQAHDDSPILAVQAALAAIRESREGIEIRIGVHTGPIITSGDSSLPDVVGKTSRLAIQLRQIARPGEVALSEKTQQLVASHFECEILPGRSFSGKDRTSNIYRVVCKKEKSGLPDEPAELTPLAGRDSEIAQLLKLWNSAVRGELHAVLIQGEPGTGKTRLIHTFKYRIRDEAHTVRELHCLKKFSLFPFYPVIAALESIFHFGPDDTANMKSTKLSRFLHTHFPDKAAEYLPFLAKLLSLADYHTDSPIKPLQHKEKLPAILLALMQAHAAHQPMLLIVEDLQWIDPSTQKLLDQLVKNKQSPRMLILLTARSEYPVTGEESLYEKLVLNIPLKRSDIEEISAPV